MFVLCLSLSSLIWQCLSQTYTEVKVGEIWEETWPWQGWTVVNGAFYNFTDGAFIHGIFENDIFAMNKSFNFTKNIFNQAHNGISYLF